MFDEFYKIYPKKVDKTEAKVLFEKLDEALQRNIIRDIAKRIAGHGQWRDKKFVPSPARYIRRKLWNDEIVVDKSIRDRQQSNEDGSIHARFWTMLMQMYGRKFEASFGETMPVAWRSRLRSLTQKQASAILTLLTSEMQSEFIPDLPKICRLRHYCFDEPEFKSLPRPNRDSKVIDDAFNQLRGILKY